VDVGLITRFKGRKNFSHSRTNFPSLDASDGAAVEQRLGELEAE
jgi:hypothetical protein